MSEGLFASGTVAALAVPASYDLPLGPDRATIFQTMKPDNLAWSDRGYVVGTTPQEADHGLVVLPRSRDYGRGLIAVAAQSGGTVAVDGQKTDGIDGLLKELRRRADVQGNVTRDHGRLFWFDASGIDLSDWALSPPRRGDHGYFTQPGVFSDGRIDPGSALLGAALPAKLPPHVVDLGAGWGYLTGEILRRAGVERVDAVEVDSRALACARLNADDGRAVFHWQDARTFRPDGRPGAVVMNPPFHEGRAGLPELGRQFIAAAAGILAPNGRLWMVANRHLPYEALLREAFRDVEELAGSPAFKLFAASRPARGFALA